MVGRVEFDEAAGFFGVGGGVRTRSVEVGTP